MKTMTTQEGKTCKPARIPPSAKLTVSQLQNTYDEIAHQYEKKVWFDQHILGVARLKKNLLSKANGKIFGRGMWNRFKYSFFPR
jgi:hypothetical protein